MRDSRADLAAAVRAALDTADPPQSASPLGAELNGLWLQLQEVHAVAASVALVLEGVHLVQPAGETPIGHAHRMALVERIAQADNLASAAASLTRAAQQRIDALAAQLQQHGA